MYEVKADEAVLAEIVRRLVETVNPDRIVLFGSRARGDSRLDSDLDLLIVKDSVEPRHRRAIPAYRALRGLGVPKDIVWYTPEELAEWAGVVNHLAWRALNEGRVLYEKRS
jgi:predicted nucleotidyltransferase